MDEADRAGSGSNDDLELKRVVAVWSELSRDVKDAVLHLCLQEREAE